MKTDQLVAALADDLAPVDPARVGRRFVAWLAAAVGLSLLVVILLAGPRPDWREALAQPMFWVKLAFPAWTAIAAGVALRRIGHPGLPVGAAAVCALALPFLAMGGLAAAVLAGAQSPDRLGLVVGTAGWWCPVAIAVLSAPAGVLAFRAVRGLAPVRPRLAGGAAGLFAGAAAACAYALACTVMQAPYVALWYSAGMLLPTGLGLLIGPRLLHW